MSQTVQKGGEEMKFDMPEIKVFDGDKEGREYRRWMNTNDTPILFTEKLALFFGLSDQPVDHPGNPYHLLGFDNKRQVIVLLDSEGHLFMTNCSFPKIEQLIAVWREMIDQAMLAGKEYFISELKDVLSWSQLFGNCSFPPNIRLKR